MKPKKSEFLKAFGKMWEIVKLLINAVLDLGGGDEDLERLLKDPARIKKIAEFIVEKPMAVITATFQQLLDACHQDGYCNSDFTESRWPLEPIAADENDWEVVERYLTKTGNLEEGVKQLEKLAAQDEIKLLTGSRRAMEYIAAHQEAQLDHPIILPLRTQLSSALWCLPLFYRDWDGRQRSLVLCSTGSAFYSDYSWLVLRKRQK